MAGSSRLPGAYDFRRVVVAERKTASGAQRKANACTDGVAVLLTGFDGVIRGVTPAAERLLGMPAGRLVGATLTACALGDCAAGVERMRGRSSGGTDADVAAPVVVEQVIAGADGGERRLRCTARRLVDGRRGGVVVSLSDVALEEREQRIRQDVEQQLRHALRLDAIGRLAGGVAHEFNNILGAIAGYASLLRTKTGARGELAASIGKIEAWAMKASGLTGQLLAFARRTPLERKPMDIHESISRVATVLSNVHGASLTVETEPGAAGAIIDGDESRLEDALLKLGTNARQAMAAGGRLVFSTRIERLREGEMPGPAAADGARPPFTVAAGEYVAVQVCDNGPGIDPGALPHVFEPFFSTRDMATAPGLGLASVYGIVKQHNGYIFAHSSPGRGARFTIYLPVSAGGVSQAATGLVRGSGTVVVAIADRVERESASVMLNQCGYETVPADRGATALDIVSTRSGNVDLVLIDLVLPGENSALCLQRLLEHAPDTPVVVASGWRDMRMQAELERAGVRAVVDKPFRAYQMSHAVAEALRGR